MIIKSAIPTVLAVTMLSGAAFAAAQSASGVIKSIEPSKHNIVLQSGETFVLPSKFDTKKLKVGEKVNVTYEMKGGSMTATKIEPSK